MIEYVLIISGILCIVRAILGPTTFDRVVAVDAFLMVGIALMALWSQDNPIYIDIAIIFAGLEYGATLIYSKYLRGEKIWS